MTSPPMLIVTLDDPAIACGVCEQDATGLWLGVPVYEGQVLPNDWPGAWAGVAACLACYAHQGHLIAPQAIAAFVRAAQRQGDALMTYALLPEGDGRPRFLCCGLAIAHSPQAQYHLWRTHVMAFEAAWAEVDALQAAQCVTTEEA